MVVFPGRTGDAEMALCQAEIKDLGFVTPPTLDPGSHLVRTFGGEVELMMWGKAWNGPKVIREETFSAQFGIDIDVGSGPAKPGGCDIQMRTLDGAYSTGSRI